MRRLLEFVLRYLDFIYLDRHVRFVDSGSRGQPDSDAWLAMETNALRWEVDNDREQVRLAVSPRVLGNPRCIYDVSLVRQHLEGGPERGTLLDDETARWTRANLEQITALFADEQRASATCKALDDLRDANIASSDWGPSKIRRA